MSPLTITIPDPQLQAFVDDVVASGSYSSPNDYVLALISEDRRRRTESVKDLLREGLASEPHDINDADWDEMFRCYDEKHSQPSR